jgi:hypothetical protein
MGQNKLECLSLTFFSGGNFFQLKHFTMAYWVGSWLCPQILDRPAKDLRLRNALAYLGPPKKKVYNFAAWVKLVLHQNRFSQVNHEKQKLGGLLPKGTHYNGTSKADVLKRCKENVLNFDKILPPPPHPNHYFYQLAKCSFSVCPSQAFPA